MNCVICGKEIPEKRLKLGRKTCCGKCEYKTPEFKQKMSEATKKAWSSDNYRQNHIIAMKKACSTESARQRKSEIAKLALNKPEVRQKLSSSIKKAYENPELRQKQSNSQKIAQNKPSTRQKRSNSMKNFYSTETGKQIKSKAMIELWQNEDFQQKMSNVQKEAQNRPEVKIKRSQSIKKAYENPELKQKLSNSLKQTWSNEEQKEQILQRTHETMKHNHTFNSSKDELRGLNLLKEAYPDTIYQYRSKAYPFNCDYYIPSLNMYIEGHYGWHHNSRPFDKTSQSDLDELAFLQEKAKTSDNYKNKIYQWTDLDVRKAQCAKDNKLNWIAFYSIEELEQWLKVFNIKETNFVNVSTTL